MDEERKTNQQQIFSCFLFLCGFSINFHLPFLFVVDDAAFPSSFAHFIITGMDARHRRCLFFCHQF
jgi:hypothetical protein